MSLLQGSVRSFLFFMLFMWSGVALSADLSSIDINKGTVADPDARVFLRVDWDGGGETGCGTSMAGPGNLAVLHGLPSNGTFRIRAFMDTTADGVLTASEPRGESGVFQMSNGVVSGSPNVTLWSASDIYAPAGPAAIGAYIYGAFPGNGMAFLEFDTESAIDTNGAVGADSLLLQYSTASNFATLTGSKALLLNASNVFVSGLTNGTTYYFRIKSTVGSPVSSTAFSNVISATIGAPVGGHTVSGTITLSGITPAGHPLLIGVFGNNGPPGGVARYAAATNGMAFSLAGVPDGSYEVYAAVDMDDNGVFGYGDYTGGGTKVVVNGADLTGQTVTLNATNNAQGEVQTWHSVSADGSNHYYNVGVGFWGNNKRLIKGYLTSTKMTGSVDMSTNAWGEMGAWNLQETAGWIQAKPVVGDIYNVAATFSDNATANYPLQVTAAYDSPLATGIVPNGAVATTPTQISWQLPVGGLPAGWFVRVDLFGNGINNWIAETVDGEEALPADTTSVPYTGPSMTVGNTYYAQVAFCDSSWNCISKQSEFGFKIAAPASITVPASDADGLYTVSWASVANANYYILEEATNAAFTIGKREAYTGSTPSANLYVSATGETYYYRVKAVPNNLTYASAWKTAAAGCKINPAPPASISYTSTDDDGSYTVSWAASPSSGVSYSLEEATSPDFTFGLRPVYAGTALNAAITARVPGTTYYYRVKATKTGYTDSAWASNGVGCSILQPAFKLPATITVPVADADGAYLVKWTASASVGAFYTLQEATDPTFTYGLRVVYSGGAALSANITGRVNGTTYYYRVKATDPSLARPDSAWRTGSNGCAYPGATIVAIPVSLTVPASDADGAYKASWGASATVGATYVLEEATNPTYTTGLRVVYSGSALFANVSGLPTNVTYYYRVKAIKAGLKDSAWKVLYKGCAVPGIKTVVTPAGVVTVPATDVDGGYAVSWGASTTLGINYQLQEATNSAFTAGVRTAYYGTLTNANIAARVVGKTYYYRVRAVKAGQIDSVWLAAGNGCLVGP